MRGPLGIALAARSHRDGRAVRTSLVRHRRLLDEPLVIALWQLGAEPFSASAIAWGTRRDDMRLVVAGDPRNRDLAFAALLELAMWFNPRFEAHGAVRDVLVSKTGRERTRARSAPQIVVANGASVDLLGRLGRRLAYLPTDGERPADPALALLGRHFQFLASHARVAGQQLVVALDEIVRDSWVTPQSALERASLAAMDAYVEPPPRTHGFVAAARAETVSVGPLPGDEDERLQPLIERFDAARGTSTEPAVIAPLLSPIERHYRPLLRGTWDLIWRVWTRERSYPEAASVTRRWDADRDEYTRHLAFVEGGFRRRARDSARQAAERLRRLEEAQKLLETEEACDDALRMIPYLLEHKALRGKVVAIDAEHRVPGKKRKVLRPRLTLELDDPCLMPVGKELFWSAMPGGAEFEVIEVTTERVVLQCGSPDLDRAPTIGSTACFSVLNAKTFFPPPLPRQPPWPHAPRSADAPADLEEA